MQSAVWWSEPGVVAVAWR